MGKKKHSTKNSTNVNHNKNVVHIHLSEKKTRSKRGKGSSKPRSDHPYAHFSPSISLNPQFHINRPQQFDPITQVQRENILGQVPVHAPIAVPVPVPIAVATPIYNPHRVDHFPAAMETHHPDTTNIRAFTPSTPRPLVFTDTTPKNNHDYKYDDIYRNDNEDNFSMYNSYFSKKRPVVPEPPPMREENSDTESHNPFNGGQDIFAEDTPLVAKKTRKKVDVSLLNEKEIIRREKKTALNKIANDRAKANRLAGEKTER
jgi:hypothetical protein